MLFAPTSLSLTGALLALAYALDRQTLSRLRWRTIKVLYSCVLSRPFCSWTLGSLFHCTECTHKTDSPPQANFKYRDTNAVVREYPVGPTNVNDENEPFLKKPHTKQI